MQGVSKKAQKALKITFFLHGERISNRQYRALMTGPLIVCWMFCRTGWRSSHCRALLKIQLEVEIPLSGGPYSGARALFYKYLNYPAIKFQILGTKNCL